MRQAKESDDALNQAMAEHAADWPSGIAKLYAFRKEHDKALQWLDRAFEHRDEDLYFIKGDPLLKNIDADPRSMPFLRMINLPD